MVDWITKYLSDEFSKRSKLRRSHERARYDTNSDDDQDVLGN